jgi:hypothetical protein
MDESEILESLRPKKLDEAPLPDGKDRADISSNEVKPWKSLHDIFNTQETSGRVEDIFRDIWEYGKNNCPQDDKDSIIATIIHLKNRLGGSTVGETPWAKVLNYVHIWKRNQQDKEMLNKLMG